ncbi:MAG: C39 family peptidase [Candidatus Levybacteria bacterium]|nr:C39 family peptidase [Candidatus Levybacteria bacterium]
MEYSTKNLETIEKPKNNRLTFIFLGILFPFAITILSIVLVFIKSQNTKILIPQSISNFENASPTPAQNILLQTPTKRKILTNDYHIFQTFNNCGPAALSMALSYYGINVSQQELGNALRPYQIPGGDNDDKSVTLEELAEKSKEYDLIPYHRPMGNETLIKYFIAYDIPVITRTWTKPNEDIGHYRIVKGYDENKGVLIQDDSLQNKNLQYSYSDFNEIWKKFNYEYLVLVPVKKQEIAKQILGEDLNEKVAWQKAVENSLMQLRENPDDIYTRFNLSVAYYNIGEFQKSTEEFEKVENGLPFRTLWYQIEPILAYYELGNYTKVFEITDRVLNNHNRAFSELYVLRGKIYQSQGNIEAARNEFEKAVFYNENLTEAKDLLNSI